MAYQELNWDYSTELYGRESQLKTLDGCYRRCVSRTSQEKSSEFVIITGRSGTGKSTLAESLQKRVQDDWGIFISGKFDESSVQKPHAPFITAVEELIRQVQLRGEEMMRDIKEDIHQALGSEVTVLIDVIPNLSLLADGDWTETSEEASLVSSNESSDFKVTMDQHNQATRFVSAFCRLLRAIARVNRPLVILIDDVQWSDVSSLDILEPLLTTPTDSPCEGGLLVVGTCRDDEAADNPDLSATLRQIEDKGTIIRQIQVENLTLDTLSSMIANTLDLTVQECQPLTEIVHTHTAGNAFFAKQFIRSLVEDRVLQKDTTTQKWKWDDRALLMALPSASTRSVGKADVDTSRGILKLLAKKLQQLPGEVVETLKVASCMGNRFSEALLVRTGMIVSSQVVPSLEVAMDAGFIEYDFNDDIGRWKHDNFRSAASSLIPKDQKASFHLAIGRNWRRRLSTADVKKHVILIVNQLKFGVKLVTDAEEKDDFARLFLKAAKEAAKKAAYVPALEYVNVAIDLLEVRHWRDQYELSLDLKSTATELACCLGKHELVEELANDVESSAWTTQDKLRVVMTVMVSRGSRGDCGGGVKKGIETLKLLNEQFSLRGGKLRTVLEFLHFKRLMARTKEEDILNLPEMIDRRVLSCLQILFLIFGFLQQSNKDVAPLAAFRMIRLTLKHGLSPLAVVGFSAMAVGFIRFGNIDDGYRFGQMTSELLKKYPAKQIQTKMQFMFWYQTQPTKVPLKRSFEALEKNYRFGMRHGDHEIALLSGSVNGHFQFLHGCPIAELVPTCTRYRRRAVQANQLKVKFGMDLVLQAIDNLQGKSDDPLVLTGEFMDEQEMEAKLKSLHLSAFHDCLVQLKLTTAVYLLSHKEAWALIEQNMGPFRGTLSPVFQYYCHLYVAIVATALARESSGWARRRFLKEAKRRYKCLQKWMLHCPENVSNKLYLVDAELEFCRGYHTSALLKYNKSIEYAEKERFIAEAAVACERAGLMLQSASRASEATDYFRRSRDHWHHYGVKVKVDALDLLLTQQGQKRAQLHVEQPRETPEMGQ
ncbi:expressed unknown protein [Seminavis robusta]|uniref:AAA+ ATPase domain-containing protein n=1 Tax=Seminavis robusta TaxID=568900 RepID=A0A9N8DCB6_9STRA|nr:expressed unknown protein [Seminavis robusta]|eukprot:Sro14_g010580.1 n/a (1051) ;mRNA; f:85219-88691